MEEVMEKLETTVISPGPSEEEKTNFENLYKNWGKLGHQEERRKEILEVQKSNRNSKLDRFRGILELVKAVEENDIFRNYNRPRYRPNIYVAGFNRTSLSYSNVLMMSEWLIEKPEDFNENWYVVPCPKGVRMLVVANMGITKCYTKYGHLKFECRTALPGGNPCDNYHNQCCVLDCFFYEKNNTMYILDLLAWNSQPMTDGETEFRHFWLKSHLSEFPGLKQITKKNKIFFSLLPMTPCTPESFNTFLMSYPPFENNIPHLDGLLFYHKKAHYFAGQTPLVGWLFPFMVPEVFGSEIPIHKGYLLEKPVYYENQAQFIEHFEMKLAKKNNRRKQRSSNSMEVVDTNSKNYSELNETEINPMEETKTAATEKMEAETVVTNDKEEQSPE